MILITHNDLDGVGCEIVYRYFTPSLAEGHVYHCHYSNVDTTVLDALKNTNDQLLITDISVQAATAITIDSDYHHRVTLYDHHKTALEYLYTYSWAKIDTSRCGTQILFDELSKSHSHVTIAPALSQLVFHINDYDLWNHVSPDSRRLNDLFCLLGKELFAKLMLDRIRQNEPLICPADAYYLQGLEKTKAKYFAERAKKAVVIDNRLVLIASRYLSDLSQYIRNITPRPAEWEKIEYIDILNFETGTHALRSYQPGFDVSAIAKERGGGGHPSASGCPMRNFANWEYLREL